MASVRFFAPDTDAYVASVELHIAEFEAQTGHTAHLRIIGTDEYFSNDIHSYLSGDDAADIYMSGPVFLWEHIMRGSSSRWTTTSEMPETATSPMTSSPPC